MDGLVLINGFKFNRDSIIKTFPNSILDIMLSGQFSESNKKTINIKFPDNICAESDTPRIIKTILARIETGIYYEPCITSAQYRFASYEEMEKVLEYLQIDYFDDDIFNDEEYFDNIEDGLICLEGDVNSRYTSDFYIYNDKFTDDEEYDPVDYF